MPAQARLFLCLFLFPVSACHLNRGAPKEASQQQPSEKSRSKDSLSQDKAIALAFKNFELVFKDLYFKSFEPGEWVRLPTPSDDQLFCSDEGTYWDIKHDGNVGLIFHAHVEKASGRVEWQRVRVAFE